MEQGKEAENSQGKPWSSVPVKWGAPLALKPSGQGRFIHRQCFVALSPVSAPCPVNRRVWSKPQASGCVGAAQTQLPTEPGTKIQRIWEKAAQVFVPGLQRSFCSSPWLPLHTP